MLRMVPLPRDAGEEGSRKITETRMPPDDTSQRDLRAAIEQVRASVMDEARPEAVKRLAERGRLTARKRIAKLADKGTFDEYGALAATEQKPGEPHPREKSPADGVVTGTARIDGRPVA